MKWSPLLIFEYRIWFVRIVLPIDEMLLIDLFRWCCFITTNKWRYHDCFIQFCRHLDYHSTRYEKKQQLRSLAYIFVCCRLFTFRCSTFFFPFIFIFKRPFKQRRANKICAWDNKIRFDKKKHRGISVDFLFRSKTMLSSAQWSTVWKNVEYFF